MTALTLTLTADAAALALTKAVNNSRGLWLADVRAHMMQARPAAGEAVTNARTLAAPFAFRVVLTGAGPREANPGKVWTLDEVKLAAGAKRLAATDSAAFARVAAGKGVKADCSLFLQLALFGEERFNIYA